MGLEASSSKLRVEPDVLARRQIALIDQGSPVGAYANTYSLPGNNAAAQQSAPLPLTVGPAELVRDTMFHDTYSPRLYSSREDALKGASELSLEVQLRENLQFGPAIAAIDRSVPGKDPEYGLHQLLLQTPEGELPVPLEAPVLLPLPRNATPSGSVIHRTDERFVGVASSAGILDEFGLPGRDQHAVLPSSHSLLAELKAVRR